LISHFLLRRQMDLHALVFGIRRRRHVVGFHISLLCSSRLPVCIAWQHGQVPRRYSRKQVLRMPWTRLPPEIDRWVILRCSERRSGIEFLWNYREVSSSLRRWKRVDVGGRDGIRWLLRTHAPELAKKRAEAYKTRVRLNRSRRCPQCRRTWAKKY